MPISRAGSQLHRLVANFGVVALMTLPFAAAAWQANPAAPSVALPAAPPAAPPVWMVNPPPPAVQFQQSAQQQQLRDQLQKRQLESSLHQSVSDHTRRVLIEDPLTRTQRDQAEQSRRDRERAEQRDLLQRSQRIAPPPIPHLQPAPAPPTSSR